MLLNKQSAQFSCPSRVIPLLRHSLRPTSASLAVQLQGGQRVTAQPSKQVWTRAASSEIVAISTTSNVEKSGPSVEEIKASLLDLLHGTERGLAARAEVRAEINELIARLEALNDSPTETHLALNALDGTWTLYYSSGDASTFALLALSRLPGVSIGAFQQEFNSTAMTVENRVVLNTPVSKSLIRTTSRFSLKSAKRVQLQLLSASAQPPELLSEVELPSSLSLLGQTVDLSRLKEVVAPLTEQAQLLLSQLSTSVSQAPELRVPLEVEQGASWILNTYIGGGMRIARGDGGAVAIYVKDA